MTNLKLMSKDNGSHNTEDIILEIKNLKTHLHLGYGNDPRSRRSEFNDFARQNLGCHRRKWLWQVSHSPFDFEAHSVAARRDC